MISAAPPSRSPAGAGGSKRPLTHSYTLNELLQEASHVTQAHITATQRPIPAKRKQADTSSRVQPDGELASSNVPYRLAMVSRRRWLLPDCRPRSSRSGCWRLTSQMARQVQSHCSDGAQRRRPRSRRRCALQIHCIHGHDAAGLRRNARRSESPTSSRRLVCQTQCSPRPRPASRARTPPILGPLLMPLAATRSQPPPQDRPKRSRIAFGSNSEALVSRIPS